MEPIIPNGSLECNRNIKFCMNLEHNDKDIGSNVLNESPYWPIRTWHIHTQHPLEFTEVLNGFDIPMFSKKKEDSIEGRKNILRIA